MPIRLVSTVFLILVLVFAWTPSYVTAIGTPADLNALDVAYTQDFNTLANSGTTNTALPTGWGLTETGGGARDNEQYGGDTGGSNTGDTYSYGASGSTERAFGGLQSGSLIPVIGARFANKTGGTITSLDISYRGEQWRLGSITRTTTDPRDRIIFEYSTDAVTLDGAGTWTAVTALDFNAIQASNDVGATVGAKDGNTVFANVSGSVSGLNLAPNATFMVRWRDYNVNGADDGLAVDDFSITPRGTTGPVTPTLSVPNVSKLEGNAGTTAFDFVVTVAPTPTADVTFNFATAGVTATEGVDYTGVSGSRTITAGTNSTTITVFVNGDTMVEGDETFQLNLTAISGATPASATAIGTIQNDDVATVPIYTIQGTTARSTLTGTVTTQGVVTGIVSNGYFIQTPTASSDGNPDTSDGIFVFTGSGGAKPSAVGRLVQTTGTVVEFSEDGTAATLTELSTPTSFLDLGTAPVPDPTPIPASAFDPAQAFDPVARLTLLEKYEGMRVSIPPTRSTGATASDGSFYVVLQTYSGLPFREPGVDRDTNIPAAVPATAPRFDMNPETISVDTNGLAGVPTLQVGNNKLLPGLTGLFTYASRGYRLLPEAGQVPGTLAPAVSEVSKAIRAPGACEFTVASMNLERYTNTATLLNKIADGVILKLSLPDIIAVQESSDLALLQALAATINTRAGAANPNYQARLITSPNDIIHNGILFKSSRVTQVGSEDILGEELIFEGSDLLDRPPLLARFTVNGGTCGTRDVTVLANHLRSLIGVDDPEPEGTRVREKRRLGGEAVADFIAGLAGENLIALGDWNAFEVNDALTDVMATIAGTPTAATLVANPSIDRWSYTLNNLTNTLLAPLRYTYMFRGSRQVLDHALISSGLDPLWSGYEVAHVNAEWPSSFKSDAARIERYSDHDHPVAYFLFDAPVSQAGFSIRYTGFRYNPANQTFGTTATITNTGASPIPASQFLVLENLPATQSLFNKINDYRGNPYVKVSDAPLAPGASVMIPLSFKNSGGTISFTPKLYSGKF